MLKNLTVENYALIDRLDLTPSPSLNIMTGETGAGKSIILGALGLLVGNRCDVSVMNDREKNCIVEGTFLIATYGLESFFSANDLEYEDTTVIRRVISPSGKSRAYVNDLPVQLSTLKDLGAKLIDIHSQHQNLMLADPGFRTGLLDAVAGNGELLNKYKTLFASLKGVRKELAKLKAGAETARRDEEWLTFQYEQLNSVALNEGEQEELENLRNELSHSREIQETVAMAASVLSEDETGIVPRLKQITRSFSGISAFYHNARGFGERLETVLVELKDIEAELSSEDGRLEADPEALVRTEERLNLIYELQHKHKVRTVKELLALRDEYGRKLEAITYGSEKIEELEKETAKLTAEATELAQKLSKERKKASAGLTKRVAEILSGLGMPESVFEPMIVSAAELGEDGCDDIRFLFSANKGVQPQPAEKIASGGEISRLMLALKSVLARSAKLPTVIFDEIDAGVSGRIADAMGEIIEQLGKNIQVINITHLPQVASKGGNHYYVYKEGSRTAIRRLTDEERIAEIANMLSGSETTDAAYEQARLLLGKL